MRKQLSLTLILMLLFMLVACGGDDKKSNNTATEKKLLTVDMTIPAEFFSENFSEGFDTENNETSEDNSGAERADTYSVVVTLKPGDDLTAFVEENGYKSAKWNDDNSLTITMNKDDYNKMESEANKSIDDVFDEIINDKETGYVKDITADEGYKNIDIMVDKSAYENAFDMTPFSIGISVMFYQYFFADEYKVSMTVKDVKTGDELESVVYPDAFEDI